MISCSKTFVQIFDTKSTNTVLENECFIYETDTLKITYSFWAKSGVVSFSVFNKLDKPIYIDWKNSSFIYNSNKLNYWIDENQTNTVGYYGGYFYNGPILKPGFSVYEGKQNSSSTTIRPERVTFIPPKSNYYRSQFYLFPLNYIIVNPPCEITNFQRNDFPKKMTSVYSKDYTVNNTPLTFRNFLAFSVTENAQQFFFIDNGFYVSRVKEMDYRHFRGKSIGVDNNNSSIYGESPFKKITSFYIFVPKNSGIEDRIKMPK